MLKFVLVAVLLVVALSYSLAFWFYPGSITTTSTPDNSAPPIIEQSQPARDTLQLNRDDNIAITLPANDSSTISTEIPGVGGIAGVGKGPTVVNITSGK